MPYGLSDASEVAVSVFDSVSTERVRLFLFFCSPQVDEAPLGRRPRLLCRATLLSGDPTLRKIYWSWQSVCCCLAALTRTSLAFFLLSLGPLGSAFVISAVWRGRPLSLVAAGQCLLDCLRLVSLLRIFLVCWWRLSGRTAFAPAFCRVFCPCRACRAEWLISVIFGEDNMVSELGGLCWAFWW